MTDSKDHQQSQKSSTRIEAEKFWEDLMKKPYNNDRVGKSFVILPWKRLPETEKGGENKK